MNMPDKIWIDGRFTHTGYLQVDQWSAKPLTALPVSGSKRVEYTRTDLAQSLADALDGIIKVDDDDGIYDCLEYQDMFKSADFRKTMEQARAALANYRKGE